MIVEACELRPGNAFNLKLNTELSEFVVVQVSKIWLQSTGNIRVQWQSGFTLPGATDFDPDETIELIGGWSRLSCKCHKPRFEGEIWHLFRSPTFVCDFYNAPHLQAKELAERRARRAELLRLIEIDRSRSISINRLVAKNHDRRCAEHGFFWF